MKRLILAILGLLVTALPAVSADITQLTAGDALANTLFYGAQVGSSPINRNFKLDPSLFKLNSNTISLNFPWSITQGGTGQAAASGTALDSITGFSGTGLLRRNSAGSYSFITSPTGVIVGDTDAIRLKNKTIDCTENTCTSFPGGSGGGGGGTVTQVNTGAGITGGPITGTGTVSISNNAVTNALLAQGAANTLKGNATNALANVTDIAIPDCPDTNGQHLNKAAGSSPTCGTSTSGSPTLYIGSPTINSGNDYTLTGLTPASPAFALTNGLTIRTVFNADNSGASRLNAAGTGLTSIQLNTSGGFTPLKGGELQNGLIADLVYNSTCTCFILLNIPSNATVWNATTNTISAKQFDSGTIFIVTAASQTLTMPVSSGLSPNGGSLIAAIGGAVTLTSTAPDVIICGLTTLGAGASATIPQGVLAFVASDGAGHIGLSPGTCNSGVLVTSTPAGGTGQTTYTDGQLLIGNTSTGSLTKTTLTAGANITITNGSGAVTIAASGGGGGTCPGAPLGRLTLTTGKPVMIADNTGTSTIYYDNYIGNQVPYYTGAADSCDSITSGEVSDVVPTSGTGVANASDLFDLWWVHSGATICHATNGSGGGWASDTAGSTTARGTGYSQVDLTGRPYITNKNSITNCYNGATQKGPISANQATLLGTFYTTAAGQTKMQFTAAAASGGSNAFLGLGNAYNPVTYTARSIDNTGTTSTYGSATWRSMRNSASNRITVADALGRASVSLHGDVNFTGNGGVACTYAAAFNRNSTSATPDTSAAVYTGAATTASFQLNPYANFVPAVGLSYYQMMESAPAATNCDSGGTPTIAMTVNGM